MSDTTTTETAVATPAKSRKGNASVVRFDTVHVKFAARKGIDTTRAAKLNRSYIRSNFDVIVKQWPALRESQKVNRDSNRYPATIPATLANAIVTRSVKGAK